MLVSKSGSVRVDLVGGTLDLEPINLILPNVITLNVATSLKAEVEITESLVDEVEIYSHDYQKTYRYPLNQLLPQHVLYDSKTFGEMAFILQILLLFPKTPLKITLKSGAPAGSGLGGSSAMGVTFYRALCDYFQQPYDRYQTILAVKSVESRILNQGVAGYQDYFPALYGGVLAIRGVEGKIIPEQLFNLELKSKLEKHLTLIYSGQSRASGINNWEVYKGFFDKNKNVIDGLTEIARYSWELYSQLKNNNFSSVVELISLEGQAREKLFPTIVPESVKKFHQLLNEGSSGIGLKMCGAGGGGCFILSHAQKLPEKFHDLLTKFEMKMLPFEIEAPLNE